MARYTTGWIKLHRSIIDSDLAQNVYLFGIWHWLLLSATWKDSKIIWEGKQRTLPPGAVVFGYREMAAKWECSKTTIKKWTKYLHDSERVILETCPRGCIITILNWETYQASDEEVCPPSAHQVPTASTQGVHSEPFNEEVKKERIEEKNTVHRKRRTEVSSKFDLESAYKNYPLKEGKTPGLKILARDVKTEEDFNSLVRAIAKYSQSERVRKGFILNFKTFAGQWRDWSAADAGMALAIGSHSHQDRLELKKIADEKARLESERQRAQEALDREFMTDVYGDGDA